MTFQMNNMHDGEMKYDCEEVTTDHEENENQDSTPKLKKITELFPTLNSPETQVNDYVGHQNGYPSFSILPQNAYEIAPTQICYDQYNYYGGYPGYHNFYNGMYGNAYNMGELLNPKTGLKIQNVCCIEGCDEPPHQRSRKSIKVDYNMKEGFKKNRMDKICNRCYYRFRYQYKKKTAEKNKIIKKTKGGRKET